MGTSKFREKSKKLMDDIDEVVMISLEFLFRLIPLVFVVGIVTAFVVTVVKNIVGGM